MRSGGAVVIRHAEVRDLSHRAVEVNSQLWHQLAKSPELLEKDLRGLSEFLCPLYTNLKEHESQVTSHSPNGFHVQINAQIFRCTLR